MAINSIGSSTSLLGQSVLNIKNQLNSLQVQLASGEKSTTYSGMGTGEGFAIAARAQLANITGYQNTITNVGTTITAANTALQALATSSSHVETAANSGSQTLNSNGQTAGQVTAISQLSSMLSILNTQAGNGYIFSGAATNTPFGGDRRRDSQRQWRPGRADAGHQRAPAGRSRHPPASAVSRCRLRPRPRSRSPQDSLAVRHQVERRQLDADGGDGDRSDRFAAGDIGRLSAPPIPIRAIS